MQIRTKPLLRSSDPDAAHVSDHCPLHSCLAPRIPPAHFSTHPKSAHNLLQLLVRRNFNNSANANLRPTGSGPFVPGLSVRFFVAIVAVTERHVYQALDQTVHFRVVEREKIEERERETVRVETVI